MSEGKLYGELYQQFADFAEPIETAFGIKLGIHPSQLSNVVQSFSYDLDRYRAFHEIEIPDRARRGAYMCKWLVRLRPIYHHEEISALTPEPGQVVLLANELFALYVLSGIMKFDFEQYMTARMGNIILYALRYRAPSEDSLLLFLSYVFLENNSKCAA